MREITDQEAATRYGITVHHEEMNNGECRFRLLKTDGTAYVRTESTGIGAWQNSHYHRTIRETYIIQKGWIALAELSGGKPVISIYHAGGMFTTEPGVVHNLYLPASVEFHTVKHGEAAGQDRIDDGTTKQFDEVTRHLTEDQIRFEVDKKTAESPGEKYTAEYRHFDVLIWQVPVWCTAIFAASAIGTNSIEQANFLQSVGLEKLPIATAFLGLMSLVILGLSQVLYRFRVHQYPLKRHLRTAIWSSASTYLQAIVTLQGLALFLLILRINGVQLRYAVPICGLVMVLWTVFREYALRRRTEKRSSTN